MPIPCRYAWPELPRMAKAVMLVAKIDRKNTISPTDRFARKKSSVFVLPRRKATLPTKAISTKYAQTTMTGSITVVYGQWPSAGLGAFSSGLDYFWRVGQANLKSTAIIIAARIE